MYDDSVDNASSFAATSFSTTTTSTTMRRGAAGGSASKTGTSSNTGTTLNTTSTTTTTTTTSTSTITTSAIDSTASRSGPVYDSDAGVSASTRADLEPDDIPRGALAAIGAEPGSGSGTGVPAGSGEGSGLGTPGRRTPVKAAAGEGLAGSYGDDSAQIAAATAAVVAAAAESGLGGAIGRKPPRVPSTLGVDEEFEGPDTSSLAAFLLSLISINPRGNKASSDTCSESGGSYVDSDFDEEEYEEVGEEDSGVVDGEGKGGVVPSGLGAGQDGRVRRRGRGGMGGEFGGEEGGEGQEEGLKKWDAGGESGRVRGGGGGGGGGGSGGGSGGGGSGGGARRGWLPPFISRFAAGPKGARSRDSSPSVTPSSSSSSLSADAGCGDAARYDGRVVPAVRHVSLRDLSEPARDCQWTRVGSPVQCLNLIALSKLLSALIVRNRPLPPIPALPIPACPILHPVLLSLLTSPLPFPRPLLRPYHTTRPRFTSPQHIQAWYLSIDPLPPQLHDARPLPAGENMSCCSMMPGPCLLVVTEDNGTVFGGFSSQALVASNRRKYQGSSDVFVFTTITGEPTVYKVTGANRYFILCLNEALSFGGGGHFALCLQEDLLTGSSGACETFCSPCLSKSEDFKIKHVERRLEGEVSIESEADM
ncbi:unnamed protein product [Closterium sp. Naga37s-1]|nr:unnamed protein product [Closterium sp. Naga37s-1]